MEQETASSPVTSRCGHCGGGLRPDAPWCTLCLTPTRAVSAPDPEPPAAPAPRPALSRSAAELDPLTAPLELLMGASPAAAAPAPTAGTATWPCASCSTANDLAASVCATCGAGFLAAVARDEAPLLVLPLVGDVTQWSKLHWLGAGAVLLLVALAVIVGVGALLG